MPKARQNNPSSGGGDPRTKTPATGQRPNRAGQLLKDSRKTKTPERPANDQRKSTPS